MPTEKKIKKLVKELKARNMQVLHKPIFNILIRKDEHQASNEEYMLAHIDDIKAITAEQWAKK